MYTEMPSIPDIPWPESPGRHSQGIPGPVDAGEAPGDALRALIEANERYCRGDRDAPWRRSGRRSLC